MKSPMRAWTLDHSPWLINMALLYIETEIPSEPALFFSVQVPGTIFKQTLHAALKAVTLCYCLPE